MDDIHELISPHYILNTIASLLFISSRAYFPVCLYFYEANEDGECQLDWKDTEVLFFLCFVILLKNRRWKPLNNKEYIANVFLFAKCANVLLFMRHDYRWGVLYLLFCLVLFLAFPEPLHQGPDTVTYFRGQGLNETLLRESDKIWIVEFYATWSPPCSRFSKTFADLSLKYSNDFFKFGKLDVSRYEVVAQKYGVGAGVSSKNLPTLILFENGKEKIRKPLVDHKGLVAPYIFKEENIIRDFDLNELYAVTQKKTKLHMKNKKSE